MTVPGEPRLRGGPLLAIVVVLLVLAAAWWWSFAGGGRTQARLNEPTPELTPATSTTPGP